MPSEPYIGEIFMAGMNFAPVGYLACNGSLVSIAENETLFSLIGTTFGGDGVTTFGLPNLSGRVPVGQGQGAGLTNKIIGETGGVESVTLLTTQIPAHMHNLNAASSNAGNSSTPTNGFLANSGTLDMEYLTPQTPAATTVAMNAGSIGAAGSSLPHNNIQPCLAINFYIAAFGIYPTQS
ncbi:MAG TPA: tail fiber protein [Phnomibacter sp.]|nr:tail fiber protein [Phnomibacter sp.]